MKYSGTTLWAWWGAAGVQSRVGGFMSIGLKLRAAITGAIIITGGSVAMLAAADEAVSFKAQILPIFKQHCVSCHSPGQIGDISGHIDLNSYAGLRAGSVKGVAVIPRFADHSPLMRLVDTNWNTNDLYTLKMPPFGPKLSKQDIEMLTDWINQGAKDN